GGPRLPAALRGRARPVRRHGHPRRHGRLLGPPGRVPRRRPPGPGPHGAEPPGRARHPRRPRSGPALARGGVMLRVSLRGIRAHLPRLAMSVVAVALGVSFVAGTFSLRTLMSGVFEGIVSATTTADVYVRGEADP